SKNVPRPRGALPTCTWGGVDHAGKVITQQRERWVDVNQAGTDVDDAQHRNEASKRHDVLPGSREDCDEWEEICSRVRRHIAVARVDFDDLDRDRVAAVGRVEE